MRDDTSWFTSRSQFMSIVLEYLLISSHFIVQSIPVWNVNYMVTREGKEYVDWSQRDFRLNPDFAFYLFCDIGSHFLHLVNRYITT